MMRRRTALAWLCVLLLALGACSDREDTTQYSVRAQVVRVADGGRSLVVDHEEIPGWMGAMRMTLPVRDAAQARVLKPGNRIRFELFVSGSDAVIGSIEPLPPGTLLELATGGD